MSNIPIIIVSEKITNFLSWVIKVGAITLWPFIIVNPNSNNPITINHEKIHIKQYEELFIIGFYIIYLYDWIIGLIKTKNAQQAYFSIRFEKEAYANDNNLEYLKTRKPMAWKDYI